MISGHIAGLHLAAMSKNFEPTAEFNLQYDKKVYAKLGPELRRNTLLLRIISRFPVLLTIAINLASIKPKP